MSNTKRAISVGVSAALLASLVAVAAAPAALAAVTITSVGVVPQGGSSTNTLTLKFTEQNANSITSENTAGSFTVTITPAAPGTGTVSFTGTPSVATSSGSLGASASVANNVLTLSIAGSDTGVVESIIVTGLGISASSNASTGAINMVMSAGTGSLAGAPGIFQAGGTAQGVLGAGTSIGTSTATVNVTTTSCPFVDTLVSGNDFAFAAGASPTAAESLAGTATALPALPNPQVQTLTITTAGGFVYVHNAGDAVSEADACVPNGVLASPGSVAAALAYGSDGNATVYAGENNSPADDLYFTEPNAAFLAAGVSFTFKITTTGVVFSTLPTFGIAANGGTAFTLTNGGVESSDRTSVTYTINAASVTDGSTFTLEDINYDVPATLAAGSFINVSLTVSDGSAVLPTSNSNAVVFRGLTASAAAATVQIGQNGQPAGLVKLVEDQAGVFQAGVGPNDSFEICPTNDGQFSFTLPPYAEVVGGVVAGGLVLRDGSAASTTNIVQGLPDGNCYYWYIWTASTTVPATIEIGVQSMATGPLLDVFPDFPAGPVNADIWIGNGSVIDNELAATIQIATSVFAHQVQWTSVSQPVIPPGAPDVMIGNLQGAETAIGQFKQDETVCVAVLPRTSNNYIQDTYLQTLTTADLPVVTATGGVLVGPVTFLMGRDCFGEDVAANGPYESAFEFTIEQQSLNGTGAITISNIHVSTTADAPNGNVQVGIWGYGGEPTEVEFQSTLTDAVIGNVAHEVISADSSLSATGPFTTSSKVVKAGTAVTFRFRTGPALAGTKVAIYCAVLKNGTWSAYSHHATVTTDVNGVAWYTYSTTSKVKIGFQARYAGDAMHAPAWSYPYVFGLWTK